jgi:hypothetical protein
MLDETNMYAAVEASISVDGPFAETNNRVVPLHPASNDIEIPGTIWRIMFICYGIFFGGLLIATGRDTEALMMIIISIGYAIMFFGLGSILVGLDGDTDRPSKPGDDPVLHTWCGPMSRTAVAAQVLTIPICFAFFGMTIAVIRIAIG